MGCPLKEQKRNKDDPDVWTGVIINTPRAGPTSLPKIRKEYIYGEHNNRGGVVNPARKKSISLRGKKKH